MEFNFSLQHIRLSGYVNIQSSTLYRRQALTKSGKGCAHETAVELLFNCAWGSAYQDFIDQIIDYLVKRNTNIISGMGKDDDTVFNACTLHWLSQIQVEAFLHIVSHHYAQEQALQQNRIVVTFLRSGFEGLYQQAVKQ